MPRKQVEGHSSHQAPANRHVFITHFEFIKMEQGSNHTRTTDLDRAIKWYENGNTVSVVRVSDGFTMERGRSPWASDQGKMTPHGTETTYTTWAKKWGQAPTKKELKVITEFGIQYTQMNTF